jgi:hypothetical protein
MLIPRFWARESGASTDPQGKLYQFNVWGWSQESSADALTMARQRLSQLVSRIAQGEPAGAYFYGKQPPREEIIRSLGEPGSRAEAVVTRNRYGALVLNTAQVPFIDVDSPRVGAIARFVRLFKRNSQPDPTLERIRQACRRRDRHVFRIYRTRAGYRVLASDLYIDPRAQSTRDLLSGFAACKYLESVGSGRPSPESREIVEEHDRVSRALSDLPLA